MRQLFLLAALALILQGCSTATSRLPGVKDGPGKPIDGSKIPNAVPVIEAKSRYGNTSPYRVNGQYHYVLDDAVGYHAKGVASWYGKKFHGNKTSTRETFDMYQMTAAHRNLPLPTYAWIKNLENGRTAIVKINDRGPFVDDRLVDLSYAAAVKLGFAKQGTAKVELIAITEENINGRLTRGAKGTVARAGDMPTARTIPAKASPTQGKSADFTMKSIKVTPGVAPKVGALTAGAVAVSAKTESPKAATKSANQANVKLGETKSLKATLSKSQPLAKPAVAVKKSLPNVNKTPLAPKPIKAPAVENVPPVSVAKPIVVNDSAYTGIRENAQGGSGLFVQLGAFSSRKNASALRSQVAGAVPDTLPVFVQKIDRGGRSVYRVRLGPAKARDEVEFMVQSLKSAGYKDYKVMTDARVPKQCVEGCAGR